MCLKVGVEKFKAFEPQESDFFVTGDPGIYGDPGLLKVLKSSGLTQNIDPMT